MTKKEEPYFASSSIDVGTPNLPLDAEWARGSFLIPNDLLSSGIDSNTVLTALADGNFSSVDSADPNSFPKSDNLFYRYWTSAYLKFTNTQIGGNIGVNCKPQFTRYADIRVPGLVYNNPVTVPVFGKNGQLQPNAINIGMGRYYSEAIDDKAQRVYLRFGVPMFNTLFNFLTNAFNTSLSDLANTGRGPSAFYYVGWALGKVAMFTVLPVTTLLLTTAQAAAKVSEALGFSQYYTMKPTMPLYWSAVNDLVNQIATYRGILPQGILSNSFNFNKPSTYTTGGGVQEDIANYNKLLPGIYTSAGALNVFAAANRAQIMMDAARAQMEKAEQGASVADLNLPYLMDHIRSAVSSVKDKVSPETLLTMMKEYKNTIGTYPTHSKSTKKAPKTVSKDKVPPALEKGIGDIESFFYVDPKTNKRDAASSNKFVNYLKAEAQTGGGFAVFVVDTTGTQSESFSNDVGQTGLASMINSAESGERQFRYDTDSFNFAGLPTVVSKVFEGAKSLLAGAADAVGISGITNFLFGKGMIEIPKFWTGSSANLPKADYKFQLNSPYGNPISQLQNIYLPLAMLLVGGLPLATGKQSYTSPFLCQVFDRGKVEINLGIIDSISITRGTTNLGYTQEWRMLGCDVSVSITDLSNVMFMPLTAGTFFNTLVKSAEAKGAEVTMGLVGSKNTLVDGGIQAFAGTLELAATDENNVLYNYLMILTGASAQDALYKVSKARLALATGLKYESEVTSPAFWANKMYGAASNMWGLGVLTRIYAGFSVNAEVMTAAQASNPANLTQSSVNAPL